MDFKVLSASYLLIKALQERSHRFFSNDGTLHADEGVVVFVVDVIDEVRIQVFEQDHMFLVVVRIPVYQLGVELQGVRQHHDPDHRLRVFPVFLLYEIGLVVEHQFV